MTDDLLKQQLKGRGVVDTHYHVGPELLDRRYDVFSLAEAARENNVTLVLKNHTYPTTPLAALARRRFGVRFLGSVVLNRFVGGLNADAIRGAASGNRACVDGQGADPSFVVYMPTVHAVSHLRVLGCGFDPRWSCCGHEASHESKKHEEPVQVFDEELRPVPELASVLQAIAETGATLATGHLSASEIMELVPLALSSGIERILITHPHYPSVDFSDEQLVRLSRDSRVFIEHCLAIHTIEEVPLERFTRSIRATGTRQVVLATDFGQVHSEPVPEGTFHFVKAMLSLAGSEISMEEYLAMFSENGSRALGLTENSARGSASVI